MFKTAEKNRWIFQHLSHLYTKMAAQHFTTDEPSHFIMDIPGNGVESDEERKHVWRGGGRKG